MDDDLGPMSKCDPMLSSPDNHHSSFSTAAGAGGLAPQFHLSSASSISSSGSSSSRCSSVDNMESLDAGGVGVGGGSSFDRDALSSGGGPVRGRPAMSGARQATAAARKGPAAAVKRLERNSSGMERTENARLPRSDVYLGGRTPRVPLVTRTSIITSTAAAVAAAAAPPLPPPPFSMIFPLPEEISQLTEEFIPPTSSSSDAASRAFQHPLREVDGGGDDDATTAVPPSKQVSLEILPGSCLHHHQDLGSGFFITTMASDSMCTTETLSGSETTLSERCFSLDDLRTATTASSTTTMVTTGVGGPRGAGTCTARPATTYTLHPLQQQHVVHNSQHHLHSLHSGTQKKVILEERPLTPHTSGHTDKVYLHL
jgi:hypothetical protein